MTVDYDTYKKSGVKQSGKYVVMLAYIERDGVKIIKMEVSVEIASSTRLIKLDIRFF